jgi:hypothetical protein
VIEYLTTLEAAELLRVKAKTLKNMKARGAFTEDVHFFRRSGLGPRRKRDALTERLEGKSWACGSIPIG